MKEKLCKMKPIIEIHTRRLLGLLTVAVLLSTCAANSFGKDNKHNDKDADDDAFYKQINIVSDPAGVALLQDPDLTNAWGVSFSSGSPFWVSDNGTGKSTLYSVTNDPSGSPHVAKLGLIVNIPGDGNPSGQVFNPTTNFNHDMFIFVSEDGTISGWRGALGTNAEVLTNRSTAVYKGVTIVTNLGEPLLLAANFGEATVDVYDGDMNLMGQLSDPDSPAGYAPFNVASLGGTIFVTFALQNDEKHDDVAGRGHGFIDTLDLPTQTFTRFATGSDAGGKIKEIDSPWGLAISPAGFGEHEDQLLVGNFGSGTIMSFNEHGHFLGLLKSAPGKPVVIDGLWAIVFGNGGQAGVPGTLYFTAGPDGESHGLFGSLEPVAKHDDDDHDHGHGHDGNGGNGQGNNGNHNGNH